MCVFKFFFEISEPTKDKVHVGPVLLHLCSFFKNFVCTYHTLGLKLMAWLSIKYNERNRNVYLGKVCAHMYTKKTRANEPIFFLRKMSANVLPPWDHHGIGEKIYSNDSGHLLFFILILSAPGGGGF